MCAPGKHVNPPKYYLCIRLGFAVDSFLCRRQIIFSPSHFDLFTTLLRLSPPPPPWFDVLSKKPTKNKRTRPKDERVPIINFAVGLAVSIVIVLDPGRPSPNSTERGRFSTILSALNMFTIVPRSISFSAIQRKD